MTTTESIHKGDSQPSPLPGPSPCSASRICSSCENVIYTSRLPQRISFLPLEDMESNHKGYRETSPLLNPRHTRTYSRSLSQEEAILGVSNNYSRFHQRYRLYGLRWYVLLVLFVLNVSNAMVS